MIIGTGIDIVDIKDFERRLERGTILKVFSKADLEYADSKPLRRTEILAGRWAAKEALGKALGTGLPIGWPLNQIEVTHNDTGRPELSLGPDMQKHLPPTTKIHLSISHIPSNAIAMVILETVE